MKDNVCTSPRQGDEGREENARAREADDDRQATRRVYQWTHENIYEKPRFKQELR